MPWLLPLPSDLSSRVNSHSLSVALTVGLRALSGRSDQHIDCLAETRRSLITSYGDPIENWEDRILALVHLSMWYADLPLWRLAVAEGHASGLFSSPFVVEKARKEKNSNDPEMEKVTVNFRIWASLLCTDALYVKVIFIRSNSLDHTHCTVSHYSTIFLL